MSLAMRKRKIWWKYVMSCFCAILLLGSIKTQVNAQNLKRRNEIKSVGNIKFENGEVYVTAADFIYLADEIDKLESTYKCNLVDALNIIGTYFKSDGTIVYDENLNEVNTQEAKIGLSFGDMKQGILASQSIEAVKHVQATDKQGNVLYYVSEEAKENNENLNITTADTGIPFYFNSVTADNISAGRAAWVNGILVKGNGEDNRKSWQNGYNEGYSKGMADSLDNANVVYTYHEHSGDSSQIGGCYGMLTGTKEVLCGCNAYVYTDIFGVSTCANCWHNHGASKCAAVSSYKPYEYIGLACGKTEQTIESATIVYE